MEALRDQVVYSNPVAMRAAPKATGRLVGQLRPGDVAYCSEKQRSGNWLRVEEVPGQRLGDDAWVLVDGTEFGNLGCSFREAIVSKAWASCSKRSRSDGCEKRSLEPWVDLQCGLAFCSSIVRRLIEDPRARRWCEAARVIRAMSAALGQLKSTYQAVVEMTLKAGAQRSQLHFDSFSSSFVMTSCWMSWRCAGEAYWRGASVGSFVFTFFGSACSTSVVGCHLEFGSRRLKEMQGKEPLMECLFSSRLLQRST